MKQNNVTRRLAEQLREKLGYILLFEIADPRLDLVTITGVEVSQDRSYARIFVSCEGARYEAVLGALGAAKGRIRSLLARALDWRVVPELDFRIDRSTDEAERIALALENVPPTIGVEKDEAGYPLQELDGDGEEAEAGEPLAGDTAESVGTSESGAIDG